MRPRPSVVSSALILLALIHAYWGVRMLALSNLVVAASQLLSAGGLLLAGVAVGSRPTFSTGMLIAAAATAIRVLYNLGSPGPFLAPTAALVVGMALAGWAAHRLDEPSPPGRTPLALRGGFALMTGAYAGFLAMSFAFGGAPIDRIELVVRILAAASAAVFIDAPAMVLRSQRKGFGGDAPMRAP